MVDFTRPVKATFRRFGSDAVFDPGGVERTVRVIPAEEDKIADFGMVEILSSTVVLEIQKTDMVGIGNGSIILFNGERRVVKGEPVTNDPLRYVFQLNTAPEI